MILSALNNYYDRLAENPDPYSGLPFVPSYGFSYEKIDYVLVLSKDGRVADVVNNKDTSGKKHKSRSIFVPAPFKRPGVYTEKSFDAGKDNAFFLWDKTSYSLGIERNNDSTSMSKWLQTSLLHKSFKRFHMEWLKGTEDEGLRAFLLFLDSWQPENFDRDLMDADILGSNICFQLDGDRLYLHERRAAKSLWAKSLESSVPSEKSHCLVTGMNESIARLHPSIKGVYGGQSSGGSIVSFNAESYESYG